MVSRPSSPGWINPPAGDDRLTRQVNEPTSILSARSGATAQDGRRYEHHLYSQPVPKALAHSDCSILKKLTHMQHQNSWTEPV